jgi:3-oxoacyl-[acyl-carrier protein] reductase
LSDAASSLGVVGIQADVADEGGVMRTFREVKEKLGDLDVLVNNAGIGVLKELVDQDRGSFDAVFATNVTGVMLMSREAARLFKERKGGNIVNISSTASLRGAPKGTAYYASKFALRGMTECWCAELRKYNVRVFLINPSEVITGFARRAGFPQFDNPTKLRSEEIAHMIKAVLEMNTRLHSRTLNLRDESHRLSRRGCRPRGALIFSIIAMEIARRYLAKSKRIQPHSLASNGAAEGGPLLSFSYLTP